MPVEGEKTDVTDEAVDVDDPGDLVLLDEADLGLRIAAGENRRRIERAAIGLDDFPVSPQPKARLHVLRAWPAKEETRAAQDRNVDGHPGIVERRVGKANGSRECAPDGVPTTTNASSDAFQVVGTGASAPLPALQSRLPNRDHNPRSRVTLQHRRVAPWPTKSN